MIFVACSETNVGHTQRELARWDGTFACTPLGLEPCAVPCEPNRSFSQPGLSSSIAPPQVPR